MKTHLSSSQQECWMHFWLLGPFQWLCSICMERVGRNLILCTNCKLWIHKKCSWRIGRLTEKVTFVWKRCTGALKSTDTQGINFLMDNFCGLGDLICTGVGCAESVIARIRVAWRKFRGILSLLAIKGLSLHILLCNSL